MHKTHYTKAQIKQMEEFIASKKAEVAEAATKEKARLSLLARANRRARQSAIGNETFANCHAHIKNCPECPMTKNGLEHQLVMTLQSATTARKTCPDCKGSFEYTRSDTPEGRALRAKEWRTYKKIKTERALQTAKDTLGEIEG